MPARRAIQARRTVTQLLSLFVAAAILLAGHGLHLALIPLRADSLGWSTTEIATLGSFYFAGFLAGCLLIPRLIARAGHIRVFSVVTTLCCAALIGLILVDSYWLWVPLRVLFGIGISGAYLIIESWLTEASSAENRGGVLGTYTIVVLLSMVLGQSLLTQAPPEGDTLLLVAALLVSLAVIPVSLTRSHQPQPVASVELGLLRVFRDAPAAGWTALASGALAGTLWALAPLYASGEGFDSVGIVAFSAAFILGGAALQWPVGRLSDRTDRRRVMAGVLSLAAVGAMATSLLNGITATAAAMVLAGGLVLTLYPLALAHANDRSDGNFLRVGTSILMLNSLGSVVGPVAAAIAMENLGSDGLFYYLGVVELLLLVYLLAAMLRREPSEQTETFTVMTKTSQAAFELDPRGDDEDSPEAEDKPVSGAGTPPERTA